MYGKADVGMMTGDKGDAARARESDRKALISNDIVALMLLVLLALALVSSEANAGEPAAGIDRAELLAGFRNTARPDVTAAASEVIGEIRSSALSGSEPGGEALRSARVEPTSDDAVDADELYVEVTAKRRGSEEVSEEIVASNDDTLRF